MLGKGYTRIVNVVALENLQAVKMHFGYWRFSHSGHYHGSCLAHPALGGLCAPLKCDLKAPLFRRH